MVHVFHVIGVNRVRLREHFSGRLRLRTRLVLVDGARLHVFLNGVELNVNTNVTSLFPTGVQAAKATYPLDLWHAWDVPPTCVQVGNNTVRVALRNSPVDARVTHLDVAMPVASRK